MEGPATGLVLTQSAETVGYASIFKTVLQKLLPAFQFIETWDKSMELPRLWITHKPVGVLERHSSDVRRDAVEKATAVAGLIRAQTSSGIVYFRPGFVRQAFNIADAEIYSEFWIKSAASGPPALQ